jgi:hypothetical protein
VRSRRPAPLPTAPGQPDGGTLDPTALASDESVQVLAGNRVRDASPARGRCVTQSVTGEGSRRKLAPLSAMSHRTAT